MKQKMASTFIYTLILEVLQMLQMYLIMMRLELDYSEVNFCI